MDNIFLFHKSPFHAFSIQHLLPILVVFIIGLISILWAKYKLNDAQRKKLLLYLSFIPVLGYFLTVICSTIEGSFSIQENLPFHVCRFVALAAPFVIWKNNRYWLAVFYFWILAGTLNANITPDINYGFPSWDYFSYWMIHSFLIILPIYYIIIFKIRITFKDLINAYVMANVFLLCSLIVNYLIGSNYMYTLAKPESGSLLDIMGPWPWYLVWTQFLALLLFLILYLPFLFVRKLK